MMMMTTTKECILLWSTQSGRAKACARRVRRILREQTTLSVTAASSVDELGWQGLIENRDKVWILFVSTTGDGEHCDSIRETWKQLLKKSLSTSTLLGVRFACFCLGDRAYGPQFCAAGRKLGARLVQLGSKPLCAVGYGDDGTPNGGVFVDLDTWLDKSLLPVLEKKKKEEEEEKREACTNTTRMVGGSPPTKSPIYTIRTKEGGDDDDENDVESSCQDFFATSCPLNAYTFERGMRVVKEHSKSLCQKPIKGCVVRNERITAPAWEQDTRHLRIQLPNNDSMTPLLPLYSAGDIATVLPFNSKENVNRFLKVIPESIQQLADTWLVIESDENQTQCTHWPKHCTLRGLLTYCMDIQSLPEREDLRELSVYCKDEEQREKLLSLSEASGSALYGDYILREKRCWADVLYDFDGIQLPSVESLLMLLPHILPRHFSIASSPSSSNGSLELCVAVVEGKTPLGRSYHGLCSSYLSSLQTGDPVYLWIKPGSFGKLPLELDTQTNRFKTPVLCIGAGTGIAPLRSLILEREARRPSAESNDSPDNILVFGCRKKTADFYYENEWNEIVENGTLELHTAFSRDQWHKIYVQQVLRDANIVERHILEKQGAVYVAGGAKMARAAKDELTECLGKNVQGGTVTAQRLLKKMQLQGKFSVEAWS